MKKIIITSGGSQLLTQIATLKHLNLPLEDYDVYYAGIYVEELETVLTSMCNTFGMKYEGCISTLLSLKPVRIRHLLFPSAWRRLFSLKPMLGELTEQLPLLRHMKGTDVVISFRHKMLADVFLLVGIQPASVILTADGVIDKPSCRNLNGWQWGKIRTPINQIPVSGKVYTPSYIEKDSTKIGAVEVIPDEILFDCFEKARKDEACSLLEKEISLYKSPKAVIFSQHLALINSCSESIELVYYRDIILDLIKSGQYPIVVKPHPRDTAIKFDLLKSLLAEHQDKVVFLSKEASAIPIEVLQSYFQAIDVEFITASSSAPLSVDSKMSRITNYKADYLPQRLQKEIEDFSIKYRCCLKQL